MDKQQQKQPLSHLLLGQYRNNPAFSKLVYALLFLQNKKPKHAVGPFISCGVKRKRKWNGLMLNWWSIRVECLIRNGKKETGSLWLARSDRITSHQHTAYGQGKAMRRAYWKKSERSQKKSSAQLNQSQSSIGTTTRHHTTPLTLPPPPPPRHINIYYSFYSCSSGCTRAHNHSTEKRKTGIEKEISQSYKVVALAQTWSVGLIWYQVRCRVSY